MVTVLPSSLGSLVLETEGSTDWCQLSYVDSHGSRKALGAEKRSVIVARLRGALRGRADTKIVGEIDGLPVRWVSGLAERHSTIYVGERGDQLVFFVEDEEATSRLCLKLDQATLGRWLSVLEDSP